MQMIEVERTKYYATQRIAILIEMQKEIDAIMLRNDRIQSVSAFGQAPPCFYETLDEAVKLGIEQAKIWNDIRGFIMKDRKTTLWQSAIKQDYAVRLFGLEDFLKLDLKQLECLKEMM